MKYTIKLTEKQWLAVYNDIARNYPPSVLLIREQMKKVLGFTSRRHSQWIKHSGKEDREGRLLKGHWEECIMLDFYSEKKMSWFRLKFSEHINGSK